MELAFAFSLALLLALGVAIAMAVRSRRDGARDDRQGEAWSLFEMVAQEVGGLVVVADDDGWPRLSGVTNGVSVEIDGANFVGSALEPLLGMRCHIPSAAHAPNAAVWVGAVAALHTEFGRPRPLGDPDGLYEVHTRVDASPSDWWQEPELHEALASLPGAGLLLVDGDLTVVFAELDAESVRSAMSIPSLIERGVQRVTLH